MNETPGEELRPTVWGGVHPGDAAVSISGQCFIFRM